ncbi:Nitrilase/cyanide hydratase and apolipoprotein N-acyltransferasefamily protein [Zostera marina]|uniref:Nitrilase/cyanide hydratase and apolipoprotein N-acyltransferasefamily protein n=1 Tax=Zostera marina TaxID=29655 RepID=A0A0K9P6S2_ZOSMR|nr:Nitrilase/cyanide hydratase and apolipoprotein N-acyltransferasefamily protein [Zostera marina]
MRLIGHKTPGLPFLLRRFRPYLCNCTMAQTKKIRVAVAQMTSINDIDANFDTCARLTEKAAGEGAMLMCLPECFSFIGAESLSIAEDMDGPIMLRYCELARKWNIWISLGGFQEKGENDKHMFNTHVLVDDLGNIKTKYRKIHLFDVDVPGNKIFKESAFTASGTDIIVADSPVGRVGLTICYDLRFPELYHQLRFQHHAQILLVPSAFTKITGQAHWEVLLRTRAIENQCYVIAAAQTGKHSENRESYGDSLIIDPWGTVVARLPDRLTTDIVLADIDPSIIDDVRTKMPICEHRRPDIYEKKKD